MRYCFLWEIPGAIFTNLIAPLWCYFVHSWTQWTTRHPESHLWLYACRKCKRTWNSTNPAPYSDDYLGGW